MHENALNRPMALNRRSTDSIQTENRILSPTTAAIHPSVAVAAFSDAESASVIIRKTFCRGYQIGGERCVRFFQYSPGTRCAPQFCPGGNQKEA
ncbi:hypothetical protein V2T44_05255 [Serratia ficaria]|uniref:hypothetical protein n=1 Tax=Serratia TaxID=613 RepID=UPI001013D013|nr:MULTISPECIES: hypothetical protein [Serratia]MEE4482372.1 hypothetical protein [Serratia ficaria]